MPFPHPAMPEGDGNGNSLCPHTLSPGRPFCLCCGGMPTQLVATVMSCSSYKLNMRASSALQGGGMLADTAQAKEDGCWLLSRAGCCKPKRLHSSEGAGEKLKRMSWF